MAASKKLDLILQWLERNPEVANKALRMFGQIKSQTVKVGDETAKMTTITEKSESAFAKMGYRLGWLGFRLSIMGRLILRSAVQPIRQMLGLIFNWEKAIETVALALGLTAAGFATTGMSADELRRILGLIPEEGLKVQTAMLQLQSALIGIALESAPDLIRILNALQGILEGVGGVIITSMVEGLASAMEAAAGFLQYLEPIAPQLGKLLAALVILSPVIIGIGTALFMMQPIWMMSAMGIGAMSVSVGGLTLALGPLLQAFIGIMIIITALIVYWDDLKRMFEGAGRWMGKAFGFGGAGVAGGAGGSRVGGDTYQRNTNYVDVNIETVTQEADYERVLEAVSEGVAEGSYRRSGE